jgi:hypothetical protein
MALDTERFPEIMQRLYQVVSELESMFPGRPFTPDGRLIGSLAQCIAEHYYGLQLLPCSIPGHDAIAQAGDAKVEIKGTQGNTIALRSCPEKLLAFRLRRDGSFEEVFNGPGQMVWDLVESKPRPSNGQYQVSIGQLQRLMYRVADENRLPRVR